MYEYIQLVALRSVISSHLEMSKVSHHCILSSKMVYAVVLMLLPLFEQRRQPRGTN